MIINEFDFFSSVKFLNIVDDNIVRVNVDKVLDNYFTISKLLLCNAYDNKILTSKITTLDDLVSTTGKSGYQSFNNSYIFYKPFYKKGVNILENEIDKFLNDEKIFHDSNLTLFLLSLWAIKDNSINASKIFYKCRGSEVCLKLDSIDEFDSLLVSEDLDYYNVYSLAYTYSNAECLTTTVDFTVDEIFQAKDIYDNIIRLLSSIEVDNENYGYFEYFNYKREFHRLTNSIDFLISTRKSTLLSDKIENYIKFLETLFCVENDSNTKTSQIKHRVSKFLSNEGYKSKINIKNILFEGYAVRSSRSHGSDTRNSLNHFDKYEDISKELDSIVRFIFVKFIKNNKYIIDKTEDEYVNWLNSLYKVKK